MRNIKKLHRSAFTIVELVVVVVVIAILSVIGITSFERIKNNTIDSQYNSKVSTLIEALEKYYMKNGEYPSCNTMTQTADVIVSTVLTGLDPTALTAPGRPAGENSITCFAPSSGQIGYVNDEPSGIAKSYYDISYIRESDSMMITIEGRHRSSVVYLNSPTAPSVTVALNGSNVEAVITPVTCVSGTAQYGIRSRLNDGIWGSYSAWSTSLNSIQTANDGIKYGYQAQARCYVSASSLSRSIEGIEATYIDPIPAPSAPVVVANTANDTTTWSYPSVTCTAGTALFQYRYTISPVGSDSGWVGNSTNLSFSASTVTNNQTYTVQVQARCQVSGSIKSAWGPSGSAVYIMSVGTVTQGAAGAAVTPAWEASATRTAGNLLVATVAVSASATIPSTPAGWSIANTRAGTTTSAAIFYKIATGSDAAPTIAAITSGVISAQLYEFTKQGSLAYSLDKVGAASGTTSPITATTSGVDINSTGQPIITASSIFYSVAATKTLTNNVNNTVETATCNAATSTRYHYDFSFGRGTTNATADSNAYAYTTTSITGAATVIASFKSQ